MDLSADFALGDLDVVLGGAIVGHQVEEAVVDVDKLVFGTEYIGDIHVVGGGRDILELFSGEDLEGVRREGKREKCGAHR